MHFRKKVFILVSLFYILFTTVPIIADVFPIDVSLINLFSFIIIFSLYPQALINKSVFWLLSYGLVLFIYLVFDKPLTIGIGTVTDSKKLIIELAFILPSLSILSVLYYLKDIKLIKIISTVTLIFIVLSFIYLIPLLISGKSSLRDAVSLEMYQSVKMPGIPTYTLLHAYLIIVSAILYGIVRLKSIKRVLFLAVLILLLYIIYNSQITTSLVVAFALLVIAILYDNTNIRKSVFRISIFATILVLLIPTGIFIQILDLLVETFEGTAAESKMVDFRTIFISGNITDSSNITGRSNLHGISLKAFADNIFVGSYPVGGHSNLLDRLGGLGLLGFIPYLMIIVSQMKMNLSFIKCREEKMYYFMGLFASFTLLALKGLFGQEGWLFMMVLLPGLIITMHNSKAVKQPKELGIL